jgi:hypothetical protein
MSYYKFLIPTLNEQTRMQRHEQGNRGNWFTTLLTFMGAV